MHGQGKVVRGGGPSHPLSRTGYGEGCSPNELVRHKYGEMRRMGCASKPLEPLTRQVPKTPLVRRRR